MYNSLLRKKRSFINMVTARYICVNCIKKFKYRLNVAHVDRKIEKLTIAVRLIRIVHVRTVVYVIGNAVAINILIAIVTLAIVIDVILPRVPHVWTIVYVILDTVPVVVLIVVADIPDAIAVLIRLILVRDGLAVVAGVADAIFVRILLVKILHLRAIILFISVT